MAVKKFGYARVSTKDQNLARQIEILKAEGIEERDILWKRRAADPLNEGVPIPSGYGSAGRRSAGGNGTEALRKKLQRNLSGVASHYEGDRS